MGKRTGVTIKVNGLTGVTPTGITLTYALGAVPSMTVNLAPGDPGTVDLKGTPLKGTLLNVDAEKRIKNIVVDVKVHTYTGPGEASVDRSLQFVGWLDGISVGNAVGNNSYQAILKHRAQGLLELTTATPGVSPSGISLYRNTVPSATIGQSAQGTPEFAAWAAMAAKAGVRYDKTPLEIYTQVLLYCIRQQLNPTFFGPQTLADKEIPFHKIYSDPRYIRSLKIAEAYFSTVDMSAVLGGVMLKIPKNSPTIIAGLRRSFTQGSQVLLENYMDFLAEMGCSLIFSNKKMYVVPINSVLQQPLPKPGKGQMQTKPNTAFPADYNSYSYNDNGYRDIAHVVVQMVCTTADNTGKELFPVNVAAHYSEDHGLTQASGVLAVNAHPWIYLGSRPQPLAKTSAATQMDTVSHAAQFSGVTASKLEAAIKKEKAALDDKLKKARLEQTKDILKAYAETKFYQSRYADRTGSITMDFNPNWVPGTGGTLYIRETGMTLAFYVTSVTHHVEISAGGGTAVTAISFTCGRLGQNPPGVKEDKFLGYNLGKEKAVQDAFLADNR